MKVPKQFKVHPRLPYYMLKYAMKDGYNNINKSTIAAFQLGNKEKLKRLTEMMPELNKSITDNYETISYSSTSMPSDAIAIGQNNFEKLVS